MLYRKFQDRKKGSFDTNVKPEDIENAERMWIKDAQKHLRKEVSTGKFERFVLKRKMGYCGWWKDRKIDDGYLESPKIYPATQRLPIFVLHCTAGT